LRPVWGHERTIFPNTSIWREASNAQRIFTRGKCPELEQTLELVKLMKSRKENEEEMYTNYNLTDTLYAKAKLNLDKEKVVLYVGAKVLIEYSFDEAIELLEEQIVQSHAKLAELNEDLAFLRMSEITVEVNMSRIFNHSVKLKKMSEGKA